MNIFETINNKVSFAEVYSLSSTLKSNVYDCFKCGRHSFSIYTSDNRAHCHSDDCSWSGDVVQYYVDNLRVSLEEAIKHICEEHDIQIESCQRTFFDMILDDMRYVASARMYSAFYNVKMNVMIYNKYNINQGRFDKVWSGRYLDDGGVYVSMVEYVKIMRAIRAEITTDMIDRFHSDYSGRSYYSRQVESKGVSRKLIDLDEHLSKKHIESVVKLYRRVSKSRSSS